MDLPLKGQLCYLYLRISADKEGLSLGVDRQEADCRALADKLGLIVVRVFSDNDRTASTNHDVYRADYEEMMNLLESGPVRIVLTYTRKRLTRRPEENERQLRLARFNSVRYMYVRGDELDLTVSANRKLDRIQAALDAGEPEDLQELMLRKKLEDAHEGKWPGGPRTYGYGLEIGTNPVNSKPILDPYQQRPDEVAVLRDGRDRIMSGDSQQLIITEWNRQGLRTARDGEVVKLKDDTKRVIKGYWTVGKLKRTLLNESYVRFDPAGHPSSCKCLLNPDTGGTRIHLKERHRAKWPYVFTAAEHQAMDTMFGRTVEQWAHGSMRGRRYLLTGIVHCAGVWKVGERVGQLCDGLMYGCGKLNYTKAGTVYVRRYGCKKHDNHGLRVGCGTIFRIADAVEAFVTEAVLDRFDSPEVHRALAPADNEARMSEVVQELAELATRRTKLAEEYAGGEHDKDDYRVMLDTIKGKMAVAESERKQLLSEKARSLAIPENGLREMWETASLEWRHAVTRLVVVRVEILPGLPGGSKWKAPDGTIYNFDPSRIRIVWAV